jgi:hypothetical protein
MNLATLANNAGRFEQARTLIRETENASYRPGSFRCAVLILRSQCAAGLGEWTRFDQHIAAAEDLLRTTGLHEMDAVELLTRTAELLRAHHQPERAERAESLAAAHRGDA